MDLCNLIVRRYTKELEINKKLSVYDLFKWKSVDVFIKDYKNNKVLLDMKNLEFPEDYSQNACDIIASKYFRKKGTSGERNYEYSMKQVAHRMVGFWTEAALDEKLITQEQKQIFYDELVYMFLAQMWAPNSPQWFNTGLNFAYNIKGEPQGHFYYDFEKRKVVESKDAYTRTQGSACFIVGIEDSLLGEKSIVQQLETESRLFKYGSGTGSNFSSLRSKGEALSAGGQSSGLMSFLKVFDKNAGAIKSGGITRRAAKMVTLDLDHPEVMDYILWKSKEEDKVIALGKMGYDTDFNGEAYETVSGQNSNNSLRISNAFMNKIIGKNKDDIWDLKGRKDFSVNKKISAKELWSSWNYAAWRCADPAAQYEDTINEWHTCPAGEDGEVWAKHNKINASNPCSEYMFLDDTACNLASINVVKFYDFEKNEIHVESLIHLISFVQMVLEVTIHWGHFPTVEIARKSHMFRTTGLGIANTATLHMMMGHPYDSEEARNIAASLMGIVTGQSYFVSSLMAKNIGSFEKYEINKPYMLEVIENHAKAAGVPNTNYSRLTYTPVEINHNILLKEKQKNISDHLKEVWENALKYGNEFGFRNAQTTVIAPTGTIAFAMDCASTSTEPFFSHVIYKKLAGGGMMEIVNPAIGVSLKRLGYSEKEIQDIVDYILKKEWVEENGYRYEKIIDGKIEGAPHLKEKHYAVFDTANRCGSGERAIEPMGHVKMMAILTPMVSGAISKTVNLPNQSTMEDFKKVHLEAWKLGIKAIALYRDGCKASQPLNSAQKNNVNRKYEEMNYKDLVQLAYQREKIVGKIVRIKPEGIRNARVHEAKIGELKLYIKIAFYDNGNLAELYVDADREGTTIKGLLDSLSKMISEMMQYQIPAKDIAKMLRGQKYEPHGFVTGHPYIKRVDSISDLISKVIEIELGDYTMCQIKPNDLSKNILEETSATLEGKENQLLYGEICSSCGSNKLKQNGTCKVCIECGSTTGCS